MRRRALLATSQMTGGGTPDIPNTDEWDYYTVIPEEDCEVQIIPFAGSNDLFSFEFECFPFSYRINGGNWIDVSLGTTANLIQTILVKAKDKIQVKCYGANFNPFAYDIDTSFIKINPPCKFKVDGTPMSLLYGDDFKENNVALGGRLFNLLSSSMVTEILNPDTFLPYTILESGCYYNLFSYCTELTNAPILPGEVLTQNCYIHMFRNCPKIKYIKMLATDISAEGCLYDWVSGVSPTGTFIKNPEATWDVRGVNGVPEGWTIKFDGEEDLEPYDRVFKIYDSWTQISENEYYFTVKFPSEAIVFQEKANVVLNKYGKTQQTGNTIVKYCENVPSSFNVTVDGIRMKELRFTYIDSNFQYATMEGNEGNVNISMEVDSESFTFYKSLY